MAIRPVEPSGQCESELAAAEVALPELLGRMRTRWVPMR